MIKEFNKSFNKNKLKKIIYESYKNIDEIYINVAKEIFEKKGYKISLVEDYKDKEIRNLTESSIIKK